ncbi:MAG: NAD(P)/FAD-dependent oxidoreductase [Thermoleophilia bacterium]
MTWRERYATQPEILDYANHVADRFGLRDGIQLSTRVVAAVFSDDDERWTIETDTGERWRAPQLVMASGCLSLRKQPDFPGLDTFAGDRYTTSAWPSEGVDLTGRRVAVIGTGSSAIQAIPLIAEQAEHLTVFQRTANFSVPANNAPLGEELVRDLKAAYPAYRERARHTFFGVPVSPGGDAGAAVDEASFRQTLDARWAKGGAAAMMTAYADVLTDAASNDRVADYLRERIREIVDDPETAELLCPDDHPVGTKRLCVDTGYYATYNRENVTLVGLRRTPIVEITPTGVRTTEAHHACDAIVFAIGFDAMTGALLDVDIRGRGGVSLRDAWAAGPRSYLGLAVAGFPNLWTITGPGSPSVLTNMMVAIEQHVEWVADCIAHLRERGLRSAEATPEAQADWVRHVAEVGDTTLYPRASSWYVGANVPDKPRVFLPYIGGLHVYRARCDEIARAGYTGFALRP